MRSPFRSLGYRWSRARRRARLFFQYPSLDRARILQALRGLSERPQRSVLVHGSMTACGYIRGGAGTLVEALQRWVGDAMLAMPTHSYCYPDESGVGAIFDNRATPSLVGAATDHFRLGEDVLRSCHPTHSIACWGPHAEAIVAGHERCETPCGVGTPYERLVNEDTSVLMFGASLDGYTLFHTAEDAAKLDYLYLPEPVTLRFRAPDGTTHNLLMRRQDMSVPRRFAALAPWLEARGLLTRARLGAGELLWLPHSAAVHRTLVAELSANPTLLIARCLESTRS